MKTQTLFILCLYSILAINCLRAQTTSIGLDDKALTNFTERGPNPELIARSSEYVLVGKVYKIFGAYPVKAGSMTVGIGVEVTKSLRGAPVTGEIQIRQDFWVEQVKNGNWPKVGETWIFFANKPSRVFVATKILPATEANIANVKALIAAAPTNKNGSTSPGAVPAQ